MLYFKPVFLHGIGEENAPAPADPILPTPEGTNKHRNKEGWWCDIPGAGRLASNLLSSEGGRTMSRSALVEVVNGWPLESRVSSRSCGT